MPHRIFVVAEEMSQWQDRLGPVDGVESEVIPKDTKFFLACGAESTPLGLGNNLFRNADVTTSEGGLKKFYQTEGPKSTNNDKQLETAQNTMTESE